MEVRLREVLSEKGVTSAELAGRVGVSKATVSNLINNKTMPSLDTLEKIAEALGVEVWELFVSKNNLNEQQNQNTITCPKCGIKLSFKEIKV